MNTKTLPAWLSCDHPYTPTPAMSPWRQRGHVVYYCAQCCQYRRRMCAEAVRALKRA